jgi:D-alanyl-D-alanine dipeptidase
LLQTETDRSPSIWESVTSLRRVPITENNEPLVDFLEQCPDLLFDQPHFRYTRATFARASVAEKICRADTILRTQGFRLAIVEAWRPPHIQRRMYLTAWLWWKERHPEWGDSQMKRIVNRFTAPVDNPRVPPPHSTGGAVDLTIADAEGVLQDLSSPYEAFDPKSFPFAAPGLSHAARENRNRLAEALVTVGLTNYPSEFWHWSYGDQGWAYRGGHASALYGPTTPAGYAPDPADLIDAPLERIKSPDEKAIGDPVSNVTA